MQGFRYLLRQLPLLIIVILLGLGLYKHDAIADWAKLRNYQPPTDISHLASEDTMTPSALHIFYINHPLLITSNATFTQDCSQVEQTIVLGCYLSGESGIYLRQVTDSRLSGVEEVTAAHEMLHGAYERLSSSDKNYINGLLTDYYQHDLHDQRIIDTMNDYKKTEPNDVVDEMHSVFGTEIANLPQPLENYYQRYFTNRSAVTAFADSYEAEFTTRLNQIKDYESQLASLKQQIDSEEQSLDAQHAQIQADRASLDSLRGSRGSGQVDQYNARVASFNQEVEAYNSGVNRLKTDIDSYNALVDAHNQLAQQVRGLYSSLGTDLSAQSAQ